MKSILMLILALCGLLPRPRKTYDKEVTKGGGEADIEDTSKPFSMGEEKSSPESCNGWTKLIEDNRILNIKLTKQKAMYTKALEEIEFLCGDLRTYTGHWYCPDSLKNVNWEECLDCPETLFECWDKYFRIEEGKC